MTENICKPLINGATLIHAKQKHEHEKKLIMHAFSKINRATALGCSDVITV